MSCKRWIASRPCAGNRTVFKEGADISRWDVLLGVAAQIGVPSAEVEKILGSGAAHAALCEDLDLARQHSIQASPTLLFNEGRQRLTGNVGYRSIEANVRELLEGAPGQLSVDRKLQGPFRASGAT